MKTKSIKNQIPMTVEEKIAFEMEQERIVRAVEKYAPHHGVPVTRRDMLKAGVVQFGAAVTLPSIVQMLTKGDQAMAADCGTAGASNMPAFISVNPSGGWASMGNWIPLNASRNLLPHYGILGHGNPATLQITREFGNQVAFLATSGFIAGVRTGATAATLANTTFHGIPCQTNDDSGTNQADITGLITRAGVKGQSLPNLGTRGTATGSNAMPAYVPPPAPLIVTNYDALASAVNVAGALGTLSQNQKVSMFRMIANLTSSQAARLAALSGGAQLGQLASCATGVNSGLVSSNTNTTNPLNNAAFAQVWNINNNTNRGSRDFVFASCVYNALIGNCGTVNCEMGGYDYHGAPSRADTDADDTVLGLVVGRILESARVIGKRLCLYVHSDGAVGAPMSDSSAVDFSSDRGGGCAYYMMFYDPARRPTSVDTQIGQVTNGQVADESFVTGGQASVAGAAVAANFLAFSGQLANIDAVIPRVFSQDQLTQVLKIQG